MNRTLNTLFGPEATWLLMLALSALLVARNQPPTEAGSQRLELIGWFLPLVGVLLSFVPLLWATGGHGWWLLRILVAGTVGLCVVMTRFCGGIDYGDSRNSGVGSAFVVYLAIGFCALLCGLIGAAVFWRRS